MDPSTNLVTVYGKSGWYLWRGGSYSLMTDYRINLEEEFVADRGTIVLLGSGLAGLAGYTALRRTSRG